MRWLRALGMLGVLVLAWCEVATAQEAAVANAQLHDASGRLLAEAMFREAPDQVLISLTFPDRALLTGVHGIQIHEVGRCDPPDFTTAGGIFNPFAKQHGLNNPAGPMAGDVPSLSIGPTGLSGYNTSAHLARLSPGPASLLRQGGTALVIFGQPDDDQTQPEGNAGARIACGVIQAGPPPTTSSAAFVFHQQPRANGEPDLPTALLISVLGVALIGAGIVLRQPLRR